MMFFSFFLVSFVFSCLAVSFIKRKFSKFLTDVPNERSSHTVPTPRGGGLAIVVVTLTGLWIYSFMALSSFDGRVQLLLYSIAALLVAAVSWFDDLHSLSNRVRFVVHSLAALLAMGYFGYFDVIHIPIMGTISIGRFGILLTYLWIVGLTNAYNFMDGIDGIAGGQAVVAGLAWAAIGTLNAQPFFTIFGLLLAASSLGFLCHNWPPAEIFMGDVGSSFLGFTFAVLPVMFGSFVQNVYLRYDLAVTALLIVWPFVFDTFFTVIRRLCKRENIFNAHRSHLYQRMVIASHNHRGVSLLYMTLAAVGSVLALFQIQGFVWSGYAIVFFVPSACFTLWRYVVQREQDASLFPVDDS